MPSPADPSLDPPPSAPPNVARTPKPTPPLRTSIPPSVPPPPSPVPAGFDDRSYVTVAGQALPYLLYSPPEIEPGRAYPLILFLHSASASGSDGFTQYDANRLTGLELWVSDLVQQKYPSFVLAPRTDFSVAPTWVRQWRATPDPAEDEREPLELAIELLRDELISELPIDTGRLYVTGYSMGAFGAWIGISRHPELFAAAVPIAGGGDPAHVADTDAAVWAFHGDADGVVPVERSREMVDALETFDKPVRYTELPGLGHSVFREALETPGLIEWLFEQSK